MEPHFDRGLQGAATAPSESAAMSGHEPLALHFQDVQRASIPQTSKATEHVGAKLEGVDGVLDSCGVALRVLQTETEVSDQKEQLDEAKRADGVQGIDNELEGVDEVVRELIEAQLLSADPIMDSRGTALHRAAERGLERVVARLLAVCPALIDMVENWGEVGGGTTALHCAALAGHEAIVAQLVAANPALIDARATNGWTTLDCAISGGHAAVVTQLLAVKPSLIDARAQEGWNVLYCAVEHPAIVTQLLAIKPPLIDSAEWTVLRAAVAHCQPAVVAQLLALKPTLVDAVTVDGWTPLHWAAAGDECEPATVAHLLAVKPTLIDARDNEGQTALHHAVVWGHGEIVSQLLSASPTLIEAKANNGWSALHFAVSAKRNEITAQVFAAHPASLEAMINDADSWTALRYVVGVGDEGAVARVLAMHPHLIHGTAPDCGWTVFHFAAIYGREKVISQVVSHVLAAGVSQPELERLLLRRSTDWYERVAKESTALHVAASSGHTNTVKQLLAACPTLIDDDQILHSAMAYESTMKYLIDLKPDLVKAVNAWGNTILHSMLLRGRHSLEFVERVWKMNPEALHAVNHDGKTPFFYAVLYAGQIPLDPAATAQCFRKVELLQWSLTLDEIVSTYIDCTASFMVRLKPLMKRQCEELAGVLIPDVMAMVFDYLGLNKTSWGLSPEEERERRGL